MAHLDSLPSVPLEELGRRMSQMQMYYERRESRLRSELDEYQRASRSPRGRARGRRVAVIALDDSHTRRQLSVEATRGALDEYFAIRIHRILPRREDVHEDEELGVRRVSLPVMLQAFEGREYIVGPSGLVVGSGSKCTVQLPAEAGLVSQHFRLRANVRTLQDSGELDPISWALMGDSVRSYVLECCMGGRDVLVLSDLQQLEDYEPGGALRGEPRASLALDGCPTFATGQVVWQVLRLPARSVTSLQAFAAARSGNLGKLRSVLQLQEERTQDLQGDALEAAIFDVNSEEKQGETYTLGAEPSNYASQGSAGGTNLLLHIAVEREDEEMVTFLLEKGANPNRTGGPHLRTALHLAAEKDNCAVLTRLLQFGGDVEVRDINYLHPSALATGHQVRRLLLHAILLCSAALAGQLEEVEHCLNQPYLSPNALGLRHKTALHLAAIAGHVSIVQLLINRGANINQCGGSRLRTALHYATNYHQRGVVEVLLEHGADLGLQDADGNTPMNLCTDADILHLMSKETVPTLCAVVKSGDLDAASRLLKAHLEEGVVQGEGFMEQRDALLYTPLHIACQRGQLEMVKLLKAYGANVNVLGGPHCLPPICDAAQGGFGDIVEFLIGIGADIEGVSTDRSSFRVRDMVEKILEQYRQALSELRFHGRAPTRLPELSGVARQTSQVTLSPRGPIEEYQERMDQMEAVFGLLFSGPERLLRAYHDRDILLFSELLERRTPVSPNCMAFPLENISMLACVCEAEQVEYASKLIGAGAEVNITGTQEQMPLLVAVDHARLGVVQLLVEHGVDINAQSSDTGSSALHEAAHGEERTIIAYLVKNGADKTLRNNSGETPFDLSKSLECRRLLASGSQELLVAACTGDVEKIREREEEGEELNALVFLHDWTVLHEACQWGQVGVVQELLRQGGVNLCRQGGYHLQTPLHLACMNNHVATVQELLAQPDIRKSVSLKDRQGRVPYEVAATNQIRHLLVRRNPVFPTPTPSQRRSIDQNLCIVCRDSAVEVMLLPCTHKICCYRCAVRCKAEQNSCPICRSIIKNVELFPV